MIPATLTTVVLGLCSAFIWGSGDFCGGQATRRAAVLPVLLVTEASGFVILVLLALITRESLPDLTTTLWALAAGTGGLVGLGALYQGLAVGNAATVAPTSAVLAAAIPVIVGAFIDGFPGALQLLGFAAALLGIWLVASGPQTAAGRSGLGLALLAGLGFGAYFVLVDRAGEGGTFWPTAIARAIGTIIVLGVALARGALRQPFPRPAFGLALLAGLLDASGNALFVLASQAGRLDVAAVLSSLYPASTVILARIILRETIAPRQAGGIVATLIAIALISWP